MPPQIALLGAAGAVGKSIATALHDAGIPYRVVGRNGDSLKREFGSDALAEIQTWDPDDPQSVRAVTSGIATIIYLVGVNYWQFELHPILMQKTLDGAIASGVQRFFLIGTVYPYGLAQTATITEDHPRQPHTFKGQMRKKQEDLLFVAQESGKIQACELRLPDFFGPNVDKSFLWGTFVAAKKGGRAQMVGPIDTPHQFVYVPDVGPLVLQLLNTPAAWGHTWNFAGSGVITQRQFAEKIFAAAGHKPKFMVAGKLMLRLAGLFNPIMREMVEMHYLQTNPVILDDSRLTQLLAASGGVHRTSYDTAILKILASVTT